MFTWTGLFQQQQKQIFEFVDEKNIKSMSFKAIGSTVELILKIFFFIYIGLYVFHYDVPRCCYS